MHQFHQLEFDVLQNVRDLSSSPSDCVLKEKIEVAIILVTFVLWVAGGGLGGIGFKRASVSTNMESMKIT